MITKILLISFFLVASSILNASNYLIYAGRYLDVINLKVESNYSIRVVDNKIALIAKGFLPLQSGERLIDLKDATVMPGLIDMHVHLSGEVDEKSYSERFFMSSIDYALRSTVFARRTLMAGFTSVRDLGDFSPGLGVGLKNAIEKSYVIGPRIFAAGKSIATTGGHADPTNGMPIESMGDPGPMQGVINGVDDAYKAVRQRYKEGSEVIKLTVTGGVLSLAKNGDNPQFTRAEIVAVVSAARDYGLTVAVHAHGAEGMKRAVIAGVDSVEHGSYMTEEVMELMKANGTFYVPTITAGKWVAKNSDLDDYYPEIVRPKAAAIGPLIQKTFCVMHCASQVGLLQPKSPLVQTRIALALTRAGIFD